MVYNLHYCVDQVYIWYNLYCVYQIYIFGST